MENPLPLAVIKDVIKIHFHKEKNLIPVETIFEELEQSGFH